MKWFNENAPHNGPRRILVLALSVSFALGLVGPVTALAATTPSLGAAATYSILGSTYTNTSAGTTVNGDIGFTTGPAVAPLGTHTNYGSGAPYSTAGTDQGSALPALASQPCTFTFAPGAIDLSTDTTHGTIGMYAPGVYCSTGAMNVGGPLTLSGSGTYIFRPDGALTSSPGAVVMSSIGASAACDVFWTPTQATTLGANTTFFGTVIDDSGITISANTNWLGRALAFGGTVTTDTDTITAPNCAAPANPPPTPATLHVIKLVVNGNGGTAIPANFTVHVRSAGADVAGSPAAGTAAPGTMYSLTAGAYAVSEDENALYVRSFSGACDAGGNVTLSSGSDSICTIINTDIPAPAAVAPTTGGGGGGGGGGGRIVPLIGILKVPNPLALPGGSGSVTYHYTVWNVGGQQALVDIIVTDDSCSPVIFLSGDLNINGKLDPGEHWNYSCTTTLSRTTTNTATAIGHSDDVFHQTTIATAIATVVVTPAPGLPNTGLVPPLINIVKVPSRVTPFPFGGGDVTYTYVVTNPGLVPMHDVTVIDDKCAPISQTSPDANGNNLLDPGESWAYTCTTNVPVSTMNVATAQGTANGFTALGYAFATVLVSAPSLPNTGFPSGGQSGPWGVAALVGIIVIGSASFVLALSKRKN
jgi:Ice-binding-like/Prealbumin-like fold domain